VDANTSIHGNTSIGHSEVVELIELWHRFDMGTSGISEEV
jgi:hypothetical protein